MSIYYKIGQRRTEAPRYIMWVPSHFSTREKLNNLSASLCPRLCMLLLYGDGVLIITWAAGPAPESHLASTRSCCPWHKLLQVVFSGNTVSCRAFAGKSSPSVDRRKQGLAEGEVGLPSSDRRTSAGPLGCSEAEMALYSCSSWAEGARFFTLHRSVIGC